MKYRLVDKTFMRFLFVGICNTVVGCGIMFLLYNWGKCSYWVSSATNYIVGGTVSFFLNKYFTFGSKGWSWKQVFRFIINLAVCYLLAYGIAKSLVHAALAGQALKVRENAAMFMGMCLYTILNYVGQRWFTFL